MRILNVTAQKPDSTGSGVYLAEMVRCEVELGHEAAVVCGIDVEDVLSFPKTVDVFPVRFGGGDISFPVVGMSDEMPYVATRYRDMTSDMVEQFKHAFSVKIKMALETFNPDVIVCHHLYLLTSLVRHLVDALPVVAICHSTDLRQMRTHSLERAFIEEGICSLDRIFALHADQLLEISNLFKCDQEKIMILGTGYNAQRFKPSTSLSHDKQSASLLYVGKIWEKKGVGCLLDALDLLSLDTENVTVRLVGGHNDEEEYQRFLERASACKVPVEFLGRLDSDDLIYEYQRADVFVLPSFFEGLPLVVVEALACGCRVVVSDLPGIRPWLYSHIPDAPVVFIEPPRMKTFDEPFKEDLAPFSENIAQGIEQAFRLQPFKGDMRSLSWEGLTEKFIDFISPLVSWKK